MSKRSLTFTTVVVAVMLAFGSVAYACTSIQGTTYITSKPSRPKAGNSISAHATGLKMLEPGSTGPGADGILGTSDDLVNGEYFLMQDPNGTVCHQGAANMHTSGLGYGTTEPWDTPNPIPNATFQPGLTAGYHYICVSNHSWSAAPVSVRVY